MQKLLPLFILLLTASGFGQSFKEKIAKLDKPKFYKVDYDKFKDQSTVVTPTTLQKRAKGRSPGFGVQVGITFKGIEPKDGVLYWIAFANRDTEWQMLNIETAILLADGKRIDLIGGQRTSKVGSGGRLFGSLSGSSVWVDEKMFFSLAAEVAQTLSESKVVEVQIGKIEVVFVNETLIYLKNLLSLSR